MAQLPKGLRGHDKPIHVNCAIHFSSENLVRRFNSEDHPRTCKWLNNIVSSLSRVAPLPNGLNGLYMGVTNHLLTEMILQEPSHQGVVSNIFFFVRPKFQPEDLGEDELILTHFDVFCCIFSPTIGLVENKKQMRAVTKTRVIRCI